MDPRLSVPGLLFTAVVVAFASGSDAPDTAASDDLATRCEYGVTLALAGDLDAAEQVFTALLSESPGDARAYNNLGNLYFLGGDLEIALVFYDKGKVADGHDPGILLNRATTLMLLGDDDAAHVEAAAAIELAGGADELSRLIGIEPTRDAAQDEEASKASEQVYVSRSEVSALIDEASGAQGMSEAASDSLGMSSGQAPRRARLWRSSAPKAADDTEAALVLYWKK